MLAVRPAKSCNIRDVGGLECDEQTSTLAESNADCTHIPEESLILRCRWQLKVVLVKSCFQR
jgi:hypothetical protein